VKRVSPAAYDPSRIESRCQQAWERASSFRAPVERPGQRSAYVKANSPFTSGSIHIGHVRSYTIADVHARFRRARGDAVLFSIGFDAFGLPAEQAATRNGEDPQAWVNRCRERMTSQLRRMGYSLDWERTFATCEADFYKWSQVLFLRLLEADLVYRTVGNVDWCERCQTTLASMQAENGRCWRCGERTVVLQRPQWYLRYSAYVEENERTLAGLGAWDAAALAAQRGLLGRTPGVELEARAPDGRVLVVFTPHADRVAEAVFVMLSPSYPELDAWLVDEHARAQVREIRTVGWLRAARNASSVPIVDTGRTVSLVGGRVALPVLISPAVDVRFGATAILGVPGADHTDAVVAQRLGIAIDCGSAGRLEGMPTPHVGVRYRTHNFSIGRQRRWGTPIPVVHCERCGIVPRRVEELPISLAVEAPDGPADAAVVVACPECARDARPEHESLDAHFDGLWIWMAACVPAHDRASRMFDHPELTRWLPGDRHVYGSDCSTYTFDQRITAKALRDLGPLAHISDGEPFEGAIMHGMVTHGGRKMSKHLGNVVDPGELVSRYGADALRLGILCAARPVQSFVWTEQPIERCHRFLDELWGYAGARLAEARRPTSLDPRLADADARQRRLIAQCATTVHKVTEYVESSELHKAVRSMMRLYVGIYDFERRVSRLPSRPDEQDRRLHATALTLLVQLLGPFAPHVAEELWLTSRGDSTASVEERLAGTIPWPDLDLWPARSQPRRR
jgi:leucyl-tRNA synthetase